jgi:hypothetical protein
MNLSKSKVSENVYCLELGVKMKFSKLSQSYVADWYNDPDTAKKLYDELYAVRNIRELPMGGEVEMLVSCSIIRCSPLFQDNTSIVQRLVKQTIKACFFSDSLLYYPTSRFLEGL